MRWKVGNKYKNKKITVRGIEFDSHREAQRYEELLILLNAGKISNLELQKEYELIPAQYEEVFTGKYFVRGPKKGQPKTKRICVEHAVKYLADFVYTENGKTFVEDVKGYRDPSNGGYKVFVLKRKLMLHKYGIRVKET